MSDVLEVDPVAEFLAREQNQLAGLEDEFQTSQTFLQKSVTSNNNDSSSSSLMTVVDNEATGDHKDLNSLSNSHSVDLNGYSINNITASNTSNDSKILQLNGSLAAVKIHEEPEKIRKWREDQTLRLKKKDEDEKQLQAEWRETAKKELNDWCKMHEETIGKTKSANRNAEKQYIEELDELDTGSEWEKVSKLCDFSSKTTKSNKDVSRMRSLILQLKQQTNTTNASAVPPLNPVTNSKPSVQKNSTSTFSLTN